MPSGNGPSKVSIDMLDMGPGWVFFQAGKIPPTPEQLPHLLSRTLNSWLQAHPSFVVRTTLPIVAEGATVGIHVWFDDSADREASS
ncbi:MAG: hypothetical protein WD066_18400 [Planctomycetaceae bacterium]